MRPAARGRFGAVVRRVRAARPGPDPAALARRVASLEVAVDENTALHGPLEDRVARLEQDLLVVLRQRAGDGA